MVEEKVLSKYEQSKKERSEYVDKILESNSSKKVVVAGPGTGKTYLFKQILLNKENTLTLTFVNSLVEDLSVELYKMSEVRTLHGYARSILRSLSKKEINVFHKLSEIIEEDAKILIDKEIDFDKLFHERDDENENLLFYKKRRDYYNYYCFASIIYGAVKYFEEYKEKIPTYQQILIDEFQDFNKLEVSLIDLLAEKSPVLLVGDDDQALYGFKSASTQYIRERHNGVMGGYEAFTLPFCSRSTSAIVEATNDIITQAKNINLLSERIDKAYKYFEDEQKNKECSKYPKITYSHQYDRKIPWFIEKKIKELIELERKKFSVLIISPFKIQSRPIAESLQNKGFRNIDFEIRDEQDLNILDGFKLLLEDRDNILGWRIISKFILPEADYISLIKNTESNPAKSISELLQKKYKDKAKEILKVLKYLNENKPINKEELDNALLSLNVNSYGILKKFLINEVNSTQLRSGDPAVRKIPIKSTTIQSSKGLAADFVFITHFDDRYFINDEDKTKIVDQDVCKFLVALTRARSKLFLISTIKKEPTFLKWLNKDRYEVVTS